MLWVRFQITMQFTYFKSKMHCQDNRSVLKSFYFPSLPRCKSKVSRLSAIFESRKNLWHSVFVRFYEKKIFFSFFFRNKEISWFLCLLDPGDHFMNSRPASSIRPVDKTLTWKIFNSEQFQHRLTDSLQSWYDGKTTKRNFSDVFDIGIFCTNNS